MCVYLNALHVDGAFIRYRTHTCTHNCADVDDSDDDNPFMVDVCVIPAAAGRVCIRSRAFLVHVARCHDALQPGAAGQGNTAAQHFYPQSCRVREGI